MFNSIIVPISIGFLNTSLRIIHRQVIEEIFM